LVEERTKMEKTMAIERLFPSEEEMNAMGCDTQSCSRCSLYVWHAMMGEWKALDGWCEPKIRLGSVRADEKKCDYFVRRRFK